MKKYYLNAEEALKAMETAFEYDCRECGAHFWGEQHDLSTIEQVTCPCCETSGMFPLSFLNLTGKYKSKKDLETKYDENLIIDEKDMLKIFQYMMMHPFMMNNLYISRLKRDEDIKFLQENHLEDFYEWIPDCGHSIYAIPTVLLAEAMESENMSGYICPFPLDYVKEKGFIRYKGYIICDGKYDDEYGLIIDERYSRWD